MSASETWAYLDRLIADHSVRVALLSEADVFSLETRNDDASRNREPQPAVFSAEGTLSRRYWAKNGVRTLHDRTQWSTAVVAPLGAESLGEDDVRASIPTRNPPLIDIPFENSRPGTWVAATAQVGAETITCISLYGLIEELTDASMHRSLSDISPIFSDSAYNELVLLGGDFNVGTGLTEPADAAERSRIVLERIEAYGMTDCLAAWRKEHGLPPLSGCKRADEPGVDEPCTHTLTRLTPNKEGQSISWEKRIAPQIDYVFASKVLADRLDNVVEIHPDEWEQYSDHRPIIAMFRPD